MKPDKGTLFFAFTGLLLISLISALAVLVVTDQGLSSGTSPSSEVAGDDDALILGASNGKPESAQPVIKTAEYPGFPTDYGASLSSYILFGPGHDEITRLKLNDNGTISVKVISAATPFGSISGVLTGGQWYKVKGQGHTIYIDGRNLRGAYEYQSDYSIDLCWPDNLATIYNDGGQSSMTLPADMSIGGEISAGHYNGWDSGYATMNASADLLAPYIDSCVDAETARPYIERGYTGWQAVPYIVYNVPVDTAAYFLKQGISAELSGPFIAAGASKEDTIAYLNSGYTAGQIMPYIQAGVKEVDVLTYLDAGVAYDKARPYLDANIPADIAAPYADSVFSSDKCMPFASANVSMSKARPFLLLEIPPEQALVYINNGVPAATAKPYVDAGVPVEKAVDEIKKGLPPT